MRNSESGILTDDTAASAVEFSIVAPVFLLLLLGILHYGIYFGAVHSTSQLAADAARASVSGMTDAERKSIAINHATKASTAYALIDPKAVKITAEPLASDQTQFKVTILYDASKLPIWSMGTPLPMPSKTIIRSAVVKRGGY